MSIPPLARCGRPNDFPLSFAQGRLWFLDQMGAGCAYNIPLAIRLSGRLDALSLERALREIVRRHDVLRTSFPAVDGHPVQRIAPSINLALNRRSLKERELEDREAEALRIAREEAEQPFDLAHGPLLRALLLELDECDHALLVTAHHIVWDRWSTGILFRELTLLYEAFIQGTEHSLDDLPLQYGDFAVWQREWLQGAVLEQHLSYWRHNLAGLAPANLPTDRPRPTMQGYRTSVYDFEIPPATWHGLQELSQREGMTLAMVLLASWQVLLMRYGGHDDVAVGMPTANRARVELESLIGPFVNTLVMRTDLSGDPSFLEEVLPRVREASLAAYEQREMPFEKLVEALNPARDASRHPLFQLMFAMQHTRREILRLGDAEASLLGAPKGAPELSSPDTIRTPFDVELRIVEHTSGLVGRMIYDRALFEGSTIERMARHLLVLLSGIVANPRARLSQLPLMDERERRQSLLDWNQTEAKYPECCAYELFEERALRDPQRIAAFGEASLSYGELDRRADRLAHHLVATGVGLGDLVGVAVERSLDMVVSLLAIHKAGGAYLPLDVDYPTQRLAFMVEEARPRVILTRRGLFDAPPLRDSVTTGPLVLRIDEVMADAEKAAQGPRLKVSPNQLAYVVYTSGSTGKPKAVAVEHRSLVNLLLSMQVEPGLSHDDVLLALAPLSFDIATMDVFLPLITGAKVVLASRATADDPRALAAELEQAGATICQATPARWEMLVASGWRSPRPLKVLYGGEPMPRPLVRALLSDPNVELWNMYGPTETTIWSSVENLRTDDPPARIGHPIRNTQLYVLDEHLQPVPIGVAGELFIGGDGVARGYLNRPDMTAERYLQNPFQDLPAGRIFRTGDRVRRLSGGGIEFLGRLDHHIKLRGYSIEPGEVEAALCRHPDVLQAVVVLRQVRGKPDLVAYFMPSPSSTPGTPELRTHLAGVLPASMVPAHFMPLREFPLSPNGKIDRRALPEILDDHIDVERGAFQEPATPAEKAIAAIWKEMLRADRVGRFDSFVDLGGHSLLAMAVLARIEQELGVKLRPGELLFGSLAQLAAACEPQRLVPDRSPSWLSRVRQRFTGRGIGS